MWSRYSASSTSSAWRSPCGSNQRLPPAAASSYGAICSQLSSNVFFFVEMLRPGLTVEAVQHAARQLAVGGLESAGFDGVHPPMPCWQRTLDGVMAAVEAIENGEGEAVGGHRGLLFFNLKPTTKMPRCSDLIGRQHAGLQEGNRPWRHTRFRAAAPSAMDRDQ